MKSSTPVATGRKPRSRTTKSEPRPIGLGRTDFARGARQGFGLRLLYQSGPALCRGGKARRRTLDEIERLRFGKEARLYIGEAGVETIKGIQDPAERYDLSVNWDETHPGKTNLSFSLDNLSGRSGTLSLRLPQKISIFEVDPRDSADQGTGPVLYKEWKLTGEVTGTGVFSGTNSSNQVLTLILQGRGNSCTSAADFTHWTLVMEGPNGSYSLFGDLVR
jgi:hypothetical protein